MNNPFGLFGEVRRVEYLGGFLLFIMNSSNEPIKVLTTEWMSDIESDIDVLLQLHRHLLIDADPAMGKTTWFKRYAQKKRNLWLKYQNNEVPEGDQIVGRAILLAPYKIIPEQMKTGLSKKEYKVIDGNTTNKKLDGKDRIILCTFQSFHHITDTLEEEDLVVLDEAHALFKWYLFKETTDKHLIHRCLLRPKFKTVFMTGTIHWGIEALFDAKRIKIKRETESLKSQIELVYSNDDYLDIVYKITEFHERGKCEIILINSREKCDKTRIFLESLGFKVGIVTANHKNKPTYLSIKNQALIPEELDFIVCTSVITTGTNINNNPEYLGKLWIPEMNLLSIEDIVQASKRFRKKLDIEVKVFKGNWTIEGLESHSEKKKKIEEKKEKCIEDLDIVHILLGKGREVKHGLLKELIESIDKYDSYYGSNISMTEMSEMLNSRKDVKCTFHKEELLYKNSKLLGKDRNKIVEQYHVEIKEVTSDFSKNIEDYIHTIILGEGNMDSYTVNTCKSLIKNFDIQIGNNTNTEVPQFINSPYFRRFCYDPFIKILPFTKNIHLAAKLVDQVSILKETDYNIWLLRYYVCEFFTTNMRVEENKIIEVLGRGDTKTEKFVKKTIITIFNHVSQRRDITLKNIQNHLNNSNIEIHCDPTIPVQFVKFERWVIKAFLTGMFLVKNNFKTEKIDIESNPFGNIDNYTEDENEDLVIKTERVRSIIFYEDADIAYDKTLTKVNIEPKKTKMTFGIPKDIGKAKSINKSKIIMTTDLLNFILKQEDQSDDNTQLS